MAQEINVDSWRETRRARGEGTISKLPDGTWRARVQYSQPNGKRSDKSKTVKTKTLARDALRELRDAVRGIEAGTKSPQRNHTFGDLVTYYLKEHVNKTVILNPEGRKIAGRKSILPVRSDVQALANYFHQYRLTNITYEDCRKFREDSLKSVTRRGTLRSVASTNKQVARLSAMLRVAVHLGWLSQSPFDGQKPLVNKSHETCRERVLSRAEEVLLLEACTGKRGHLRGLLIAALDTGMRRGEMFKLDWSDVDFHKRRLTLRASTTKTERSRIIPISNRLLVELTRLRDAGTGVGTVFGIRTDVKKAFKAACNEAGITAFTLHDCRHTYVTKVLDAGVPPHIVQQTTGHSTLEMLARYANRTETADEQLLRVLNAPPPQDL